MTWFLSLHDHLIHKPCRDPANPSLNLTQVQLSVLNYFTRFFRRFRTWPRLLHMTTRCFPHPKVHLITWKCHSRRANGAKVEQGRAGQSRARPGRTVQGMCQVFVLPLLATVAHAAAAAAGACRQRQKLKRCQVASGKWRWPAPSPGQSLRQKGSQRSNVARNSSNDEKMLLFMC